MHHDDVILIISLQLGQDMGQTVSSFKRTLDASETEVGVAKEGVAKAESRSKSPVSKLSKKWKKSKKKKQGTDL